MIKTCYQNVLHYITFQLCTENKGKKFAKSEHERHVAEIQKIAKVISHQS